MNLGVTHKGILLTCKIPLILFFSCSLLFLPSTAQSQELSHRGLFVSVIQDPPVLSSRQEITRLVGFAKKARINVLFVQVYRANKAWFSSKVGDPEPYKKCLESISEDPLALLIKEAHAAGIQVHAWFNLLSLSANLDAPLLKKYGTQILTRNLEEKKTVEDYKIDNQYFLEPGDLRVRGKLAAILGEVLRAYPDLDGVQFDYIRYPDVHPAYGFTKINMERFKKTTGSETIDGDSAVWKDWKSDQVTGLLRLLVKKARLMRPGIQVSTTALTSYSRANLEAFQDWASWLKSGLVDFITLMSYPPDVATFSRYVQEARDKAGDLKKVNIAVGAYKLLKTPEIFKRQFEICEETGGRGCVVLHYGNLLENPVLADVLTRDAQ